MQEVASLCHSYFKTKSIMPLPKSGGKRNQSTSVSISNDNLFSFYFSGAACGLLLIIGTESSVGWEIDVIT